ncbi:MAG: STAS domain-containing protein [Clostridia bacterium]|nr:STAS domain-containing protein [Clostridia bacterium]
MEIIKSISESTLNIALQGRLDANTAPELEGVLISSLSGITGLVFDFSELEYISSAGLRILLIAQKKMNTQGTMKLRGVCPAIKEILDITGFSDILTIE